MFLTRVFDMSDIRLYGGLLVSMGKRKQISCRAKYVHSLVCCLLSVCLISHVCDKYGIESAQVACAWPCVTRSVVLTRLSLYFQPNATVCVVYYDERPVRQLRCTEDDRRCGTGTT